MSLDMSAHRVCKDPNIWVLDDLLSPQLLDYIDNQFESGEAQGPRPGGCRSMPSTLERGIEVNLGPESEELFDTLRSITNIEEVETCRKLLIYDVIGQTQESHVDHISLDTMPEWQGYHKCQLDFAKQSVSKWCPDQIVPTFTFVVYFNDVGGIHFPNAHLKDKDKTIKCKRGRIVMFQNYIDELRPKHNDMCTHYGLYDENVPKRILTGGIVANATPSIGHSAKAPEQGWIYSVAKHRTSHHEEPAPPRLQAAGDRDRDNKENVLHAIKEDYKNFQYASNRLRGDEEVVKIAIDCDPFNLQFVDVALKDKDKIVEHAVKKKGMCLRFASDRLRNDRKMVETSMFENPNAFQYASDSLRSNRDLVMFAVARDGRCLQHVDDEFKNDKEVVLTAVRQIKCSMQFASDAMKEDDEVVLASVGPKYDDGSRHAPKKVIDRLTKEADACGVTLADYAKEQPTSRLVQLSGTKDESDVWTVRCTDLTGEDIAVIEFMVAPESENHGFAFRRKLAETLGVSPAALRILLPGGQRLSQVKAACTFDQLMAPTPCIIDHSKEIKMLRALIKSETLFQKHCDDAFNEFDKNHDDSIDVEEACTLVQRLCKRCGLRGSSFIEANLRAAFHEHDLEGTGKLRGHNFALFFKQILKSVLTKLEEENDSGTV